MRRNRQLRNPGHDTDSRRLAGTVRAPSRVTGDLPAPGVIREIPCMESRGPRVTAVAALKRRGKGVQQVPLAAPLRSASCSPGEMSDSKLAALVYRNARCARCFVHPDQWFPVSKDTAKAREEASAAIAVCDSCPVRAQCLELSIRHNPGFGADGVWGGLVESARHPRRPGWRHGIALAPPSPAVLT